MLRMMKVHQAYLFIGSAGRGEVDNERKHIIVNLYNVYRQSEEFKSKFDIITDFVYNEHQKFDMPIQTESEAGK